MWSCSEDEGGVPAYCFAVTYVSEYECDDSDKGKDFFTKGIASITKDGKVTHVHEDLCSEDGKILHEAVCTISENMVWAMTTEYEYSCPSGCKDGACKVAKDLSCGSAGGKSFSSVPVKNLCADDSTPHVTAKDGGWSWQCGPNKCFATDPNAEIKARFSATEISYIGDKDNPDLVKLWMEGDLVGDGIPKDNRIFDKYDRIFSGWAGKGSHGACESCSVQEYLFKRKGTVSGKGVCGEASGSYSADAKAYNGNLCLSGIPIPDKPVFPEKWACYASDKIDYCYANQEVVKTNEGLGKCGKAGGLLFSQKPTTGLCDNGKVISFSENNEEWSWVCAAQYSAMHCRAYKLKSNNGCSIASLKNCNRQEIIEIIRSLIMKRPAR